MATIQAYTLNGYQAIPPREWADLQIEATFDNDSIQANINLSVLNFVNESNELIKTWLQNNVGAFEGMPIDIQVQDNNQSLNVFTGYLDFREMTFKSPIETEVKIIKSNNLNQLSERAKGITMRLLQDNGFMPISNGVNVPFVIRNRKTNLEKLQFSIIVFSSIKAFIDEIFKLIAIASDITTAGVAQAIINLVLTIANLVVIVQKLIDLFTEYMTTYYPLVQNHRAIKLKTFIEKGLQYMGYTVDFGNFAQILDGVVLLPNKDDEDSAISGFVQNSTTTNQISGILKPKNYGYTLEEAFDLLNRMFYTKVAIIGNTVHVKPYNDSFWNTQSGYVMPNVLIENAFYSNGEKTYNVDELVGRTLIEYETDDSDKWTITNINDSISEVAVEPLTINNKKNVLINKYDNINIPYTLCNRLDEEGNLFNKVQAFVGTFNGFIDDINDTFNSVASIFGSGNNSPQLNYVSNPMQSRVGALLVENAFFSKPKIVYLGSDGKIPSNFKNIIGAKALYQNYHSYKSFVPGVRNTSNSLDTNQKTLYRNVKIPFGYSDFNLIVNNSFFDFNGKNAKFTSIKWNVDKDYAIVDFYVNEIYTTNLKETIY